MCIVRNLVLLPASPRLRVLSGASEGSVPGAVRVGAVTDPPLALRTGDERSTREPIPPGFGDPYAPVLAAAAMRPQSGRVPKRLERARRDLPDSGRSMVILEALSQPGTDGVLVLDGVDTSAIPRESPPQTFLVAARAIRARVEVLAHSSFSGTVASGTSASPCDSDPKGLRRCPP